MVKHCNSYVRVMAFEEVVAGMGLMEEVR